MNILAIAEHYPSPFKTYHDAQFERFVLDGHQLTICAFGLHQGELNPAVRRLGLNEGVKYLPITLKSLPGSAAATLLSWGARPLTSIGRARKVTELSRGWKRRLMDVVRAVMLPRGEPDLCIVHNLRAQIQVRFLSSIYPKAAVAFYYHGGEVPGVPAPRPEEVVEAFASADVVFTNTESSKQNAIGRGCAPEKIHISPVGFNLDAFPDPADRSYRRDGVLNLFMAGRLSEEKGMLLGVRALNEVVGRGHTALRLRLVGQGHQRDQIMNYIAEHGIAPYVEVLGSVSQERLMEEYRRADVFMLPSVKYGTWEENQACVVQEALFMRAVAAISRTGGVPESTAPEMLPYSFEPGDVAGLADSIERLLGLDEAELARLGAAGRSFVERKYDIRGLNAELIEVALSRRAKRSVSL